MKLLFVLFLFILFFLILLFFVLFLLVVVLTVFILLVLVVHKITPLSEIFSAKQGVFIQSFKFSSVFSLMINRGLALVSIYILPIYSPITPIQRI